VGADAALTVATLRALTKVTRFDMALMLLPKQAKEYFTDVFAQLKANQEVDQKALQTIRKSFKL
jgi:hypothetical protein